jgi:hypothetical protein
VQIACSDQLRRSATDISSSCAVTLMQGRQYCGHHSVSVGAVNTAKVAYCTGKKCSKRACFGFLGQVPIYCRTCVPKKLKGTIRLTRGKSCEHEGCNTSPKFGTVDRVSS